jgi:LPXTG-motif cell wall-anchored protein
MKKLFVLVIAVVLLAAMTPMALAADTVYVTVSVDGKLEIAAQPVTVSDMTADAVIRAAHAAYYSGGESGYAADIDAMYNMYIINQCWGVAGTPFVIINGAPLGAGENASYLTVDATPVKGGDNIVLSISSDMMSPARAISLTASVSGDSVTVNASEWVLDFTTFQYTSSPLANAAVVDPISGASLGTTDANGGITVTTPESGIIAIDGLSAIAVSAGGAAAADGPSADYSKLPQTGGIATSTIIGFVGLALILVGAATFAANKKRAKSN